MASEHASENPAAPAIIDQARFWVRAYLLWWVVAVVGTAVAAVRVFGQGRAEPNFVLVSMILVFSAACATIAWRLLRRDLIRLSHPTRIEPYFYLI